ncbi:MAG TPA: flavodoxin-dependent (E)-4-hydroxy-3-methylbut-2-enyl-diphosphate synthase [Spirochaetota bacterium]|nr:flavodoxin-dependent (E)-4-hydroxy-3-methylbut-2-enyl-diphosphate synthase [Spirochaetota bacterium]HPU88374.1 flavodoxin-dependent (E)-4-hydroxy-3-methylbut-2-enyl-diphosphate synthase [Spirochaetota bacterium]
MTIRKKTRPVAVRSLVIGGEAPVSIQSMTNLPIEDVRGTVAQIERLRAAGADLVRLALRNEDSIAHLREIRTAVDMPLSADVHFNHRIAIKAIEAGIDKVRINPGNIGDDDRVRDVVAVARERRVPIRIGVNGGSIDLKTYHAVSPESLAQSALDHVRILEDNDFRDIVVSIKSSDIRQTIDANVRFSELRDYPLHIGLTEAGYGASCIVQSTLAIGHLLLMGLGDTVRVSMTGDPVGEIPVARTILEAAGLRVPTVRIIACPTCGRTDPSLDILALAERVESETARFHDALYAAGRTVTVAVMGCEVNGPGEAAHADVGLAGGRGGRMILFAKGEKIAVVDVGDAVARLVDEIEAMIAPA